MAKRPGVAGARFQNWHCSTNCFPKLAGLREQLFSELKAQGDPRMLGRGAVFEQYPYANEGQRNFYERFMRGEKLNASWVERTDFEPKPLEAAPK